MTTRLSARKERVMADPGRYMEYGLRLILSMVCGGLIGYERKASNQSAGLRTHILVCVASALVLITSEDVFIHFLGVVNSDPMRMGAQIISGIGFLGAGAIVKEGANIKGLTTAACLWAVACVGIALGSGFYFGAIFATALIFAVLSFFRPLERLLTNDRVFHTIVAEVNQANKDRVLEEIRRIFATYHAKTKRTREVAVDDTIYIRFDYLLYEIIPEKAVIQAISRIDGVALSSR